MLDNCPLTAWVVEVSEPVTPAAVPAAIKGALAVRVGHMEVRVPGVDVHPTVDTPTPVITAMQRVWLRLHRNMERSAALVILETVMNKVAYSASPKGYVSNGLKTFAVKIVLVVTASAIGLHDLE